MNLKYLLGKIILVSTQVASNEKQNEIFDELIDERACEIHIYFREITLIISFIIVLQLKYVFQQILLKHVIEIQQSYLSI